MSWTRADFPTGFLFGAATSSYQIEGHAHGGADPTQWQSFSETPGNVAQAENGLRACDHYHRWPEDLDLAADMGLDLYRFSTSWARVQPEGRGPANPQGLDFYDQLVDGMLQRGLKPALTLYHWELPQALGDLGGWRNRDIADRFAEYAELLLARIGDRIWSVAPINEPFCVSWLGHFIGHHAPGLRDIRATAHAMHHVLLAHGRAIQAMRAMGQPNLGGVFNFERSLPADPDSPEDQAAAARYDAIHNRAFLEAVFKSRYPDLIMQGLGQHLPEGFEQDFETISAPLDWVGLNYYTCKRIAVAPGPWPALLEREGPLPKTQMDWEIHPEGLSHFLRMVARDYAHDLPLYVTENGMASSTADPLQDSERLTYLDAHLSEARQVIAEGLDLRGYIFWSLMDNYEWALGYEKRFGLVHVDFESLQRRPKASYQALARRLQPA